MTAPMIPYPFMNTVEKMREGERRYGALLTNSVYVCDKCENEYGNETDLETHFIYDHKMGIGQAREHIRALRSRGQLTEDD